MSDPPDADCPIMQTRTRSWKFAHWSVAALGALCAAGLCVDLLSGEITGDSSYGAGQIVGRCFWIAVGLYAAHELRRARRGEPLSVPDSRPYVAGMPAHSPQRPDASAPQAYPVAPQVYPAVTQPYVPQPQYPTYQPYPPQPGAWAPQPSGYAQPQPFAQPQAYAPAPPHPAAGSLPQANPAGTPGSVPPPTFRP